MDRVREIASLVRRIVSATYLGSKGMYKRYGLTGPQALALRTLHLYGAASTSALSRTMFVSPSNLTGIADRLAARGFIERTRKVDDRRVQFLTLTERGADMAGALPDPIEAQLVAGIGQLEPGELEKIASAFRTVAECLGRLDQE